MATQNRQKSNAKKKLLKYGVKTKCEVQHANKNRSPSIDFKYIHLRQQF